MLRQAMTRSLYVVATSPGGSTTARRRGPFDAAQAQRQFKTYDKGEAMFEGARRKMGKPVPPPLDHPALHKTTERGSGSLRSSPASVQPETKAEAERRTPERGISLGGRFIKLKNGPDLFGNTAYSVIIDFCKDREGDAGDLVTFDGSFSISVGKSTLTASVGTSRGERTMSSGGLRLAVKTWYQVALIFSSAAGRADLLLDRSSLATVGDLKGETQFGNLFADLYIGSPKGGGFTGRIDNFRLLDGAVSECDLRSGANASAR